MTLARLRHRPGASPGGQSAVHRRWLGLVLGFTALAIIILAVGMFLRSRPRTTPSIIFILIDTLRADYLGTYGFPCNVSPAIDRFAAQSVVFENAFAQAPWTKPSVASIFTSFHPEQHGVLTHRGRYGDPSTPTDETDVLPEEALTLAECLHAAGYATAAVVANPWILRELGFAQGFETFLELGRRGTPAGRSCEQGAPGSRAGTTVDRSSCTCT